MKALGIIPVRGGSKGLPGKNIKDLAGLPLLAYTLRSALDSELLDDHLVSTDSDEIADVARAYGGKVPFMRDGALATDEANVVDVVQDVLDRLKELPEYLVLLQATCPLREAEDIDQALTLAFRSEAGSVCGFTQVESGHPHYMYVKRGERLEAILPTEAGARRQTFDEVLLRNGALYAVKTEVFLREKVFVTEDCVPYVMPAERAINIDTLEDLRLAEFHLTKRKEVSEQLPTRHAVDAG